MMTLYKKIIVPLDGSELSDQALRPAMLMAETTGATVNLVRCFASIPRWQVDRYQGRHSGSMSESEHARITAWLKAHKLRLAKDGSTVPIEVSAHEGPAVEHITRLANQEPDALIVMSTHGRGDLSRLIMGSVTSRVVRAVRNPMFIVRSTETDMLNTPEVIDRIIVPLDGTTFSEAALSHAGALAASFGARVTLYQATHGAGFFQSNSEWVGSNGEAGFEFSSPSKMATELAVQSMNYLSDCADSLKAEFGLTRVDVVNSQENAADAIVRLAGDSDNGLVVMTTHGRAGVGRALLGSVADRVVRASPVPTLLVQEPAVHGDMSVGRSVDNLVGAVL